MYCRNCGNEIQEEEKICSSCGEKNPDFKIKKNIIKMIIIGIGISILIAIYIGILANSSSKTSATSPTTSESDTTSKDASGDVIFDAKKLIGAKKQDVDVLLNIKGIQDTNEPYVYHYGEDTDVVYDDNGICLDLCLDTDGKGYKSYDEAKIFKSYGLDLTDSYYKQSNEYVKTYTKIKDFGEIDIFYDSKKGGSSSDIKQIVFYTKNSKELSDFLEKKSESFENELDKNTNLNATSSTETNNDLNSSIRQKRLQANWVDNANKSDLYNDYAYELEGVEGSTQNLIGKDKSNINICYDKYNDYINRLWNDLKKQYSEEEFKKLTKDENDWISKKISKYPTCDSENGTFNDKYGAIQMTDERIGKLLKYLN